MEKEGMNCEVCGKHLGWCVVSVADDHNLEICFYCDEHKEVGE